MPLASSFALQWYGPACAAMVATGEGAAQIAARRNISPSLSVVGTGTAQIRPYRGRRAALDTGGTGTLYMRPARTVRAALVVSVNELSQDDVSGAVANTIIEGDVTLKQAVRALLSIAQGLTVITDTGPGTAQVAFRDLANAKNRFVFTMDGSERTAVTRDLT